ncbi:restriction endonuclease subunit S [Achromobacter xylosoxidans]
MNSWRPSTWGDEISLEYGKAIRGYESARGSVRVFGSNGPIGWTEKSLAKGPGVILGRKGAYRGVQYSEDEFFVIDTAYYVVPKTDLDMRWLYYAIQYHKLGEIDDGSPIPSTTRAAVYVRELDVPPKDVQKEIARILGAIDDKIDLNRRINQTLETMAQAIFKSWFVDFDPVKAKIAAIKQGQDPLRAAMRAISGKTDTELDQMSREHHDQLATTAALFPDAMEASELGEIPKGWVEFCFGDVAQQCKGTVNPATLPKELFTHYSLPAFDDSRLPIVETGESIKSNKTPVPDGAVLVSKLNPHIPRIWLVGRPGERAVCSTEFIVWTPKVPANSAFVYGLASSPAFNSAMRQLVTGTSNSHQRVKPEQLADIRVFTADEEAITQYSMSVAPIMEKIILNREEASMLANLRDTLLPKILSGELSVDDLIAENL